MTNEVESLQAKVAEAQHLFENDFYEGSISHAYYAMFHAAEEAHPEGPLARAMNEYAKLRSGAKIETRP